MKLLCKTEQLNFSSVTEPAAKGMCSLDTRNMSPASHDDYDVPQNASRAFTTV